jgi:serine/threonine protein kinase
MLTGDKPYKAENAMTVLYMHRNTPIPPLEPRLAMLQPVLDKLMAKRPDDRYGNALEAAAALSAARTSWLEQVTES